MKKLTYRSAEQLHNDAVKLLLERHLSWSGSDKNMPSDDLDNVRGQYIDAYIDAVYPYEEWDAMSDEERKEATSSVNLMFEVAASEADLKWTAAKVMLDL